MATAVALRPPPLARRVHAAIPLRWRMPLAAAAGVTAITALSALIRSQHIGVHYWIDEGLSVGIARHHLLAIPGVLREDGSPPLYYMLLAVWMKLAGGSEGHTHLLSLFTSLLTVPAAFWAVDGIFGRRAAWIAAGLFALDPFLTGYATETRMYALVILLCLLATGCWLRVFVQDRRAWAPGFAVALAGLLYTHNWAAFYAVGTVIALVLLARGTDGQRRRRLIGHAVWAYLPAAILFAPWLPSLLYQVEHTGAPWAEPPSFSILGQSADVLLGGPGTMTALLLGGGAGLTAVLRHRRTTLADGVTALIAISLLTVISAWVFSQLSPAWANRYLAIGLAPLLLLAAVGVSRAGRLGMVALLVVGLGWIWARPPSVKSNAAEVSHQVGAQLNRGDIVYATQPEMVPLLSYYLPKGVRYYTPLGATHDVGVTNWVDALHIMRQSTPAHQLAALARQLRPGMHLVVVRPLFYDVANWKAPWTKLIRVRSWRANRVILELPGLRAGAPVGGLQLDKLGPNAMRAQVFTRL